MARRVRTTAYSGRSTTMSVGEYVEREIDRAGGYGYGQIEQLQVELNATKEVLLRVVDVLADLVDEDDIRRICDQTPDRVYADRFEVLKGKKTSHAEEHVIDEDVEKKSAKKKPAKTKKEEAKVPTSVLREKVKAHRTEGEDPT